MTNPQLPPDGQPTERPGFAPPPPGQQPPGQGPYPPPGPPPKKGMGAGAKILIACLVGIFALCGLGIIVTALSVDSSTTTGAGSGDRTPDPPASTPEPEPAGPGSTPQDPAPLGTEVTAAKGWPIKVTAVTLSADTEVAQLSEYSRPKAGHQFALVDVTTTNGIGRPDAIGGHLKLSLLGSSGVAIRPGYADIPNRLDEYAQLQPGTTVSGRLIFEVPKDQVDSVVLLVEPVFTLDENTDQRFLALR